MERKFELVQILLDTLEAHHKKHNQTFYPNPWENYFNRLEEETLENMKDSKAHEINPLLER